MDNMNNASERRSSVYHIPHYYHVQSHNHHPHESWPTKLILFARSHLFWCVFVMPSVKKSPKSFYLRLNRKENRFAFYSLSPVPTDKNVPTLGLSVLPSEDNLSVSGLTAKLVHPPPLQWWGCCYVGSVSAIGPFILFPVRMFLWRVCWCYWSIHPFPSEENVSMTGLSVKLVHPTPSQWWRWFYVGSVGAIGPFILFPVRRMFLCRVCQWNWFIHPRDEY